MNSFQLMAKRLRAIRHKLEDDPQAARVRLPCLELEDEMAECTTYDGFTHRLNEWLRIMTDGTP